MNQEEPWVTQSTTDAEKVMRLVIAAHQFFCSCGSSRPDFAQRYPLSCPYLRFAFYTIFKSFAWHPTNFNNWFIHLIMRRVKSGLLSYFLQKRDETRRIIGGIQNSMALLFASDFCMQNPPEIMCFSNPWFDYSKILLVKEIHRKSFEIAFNGYLVPFCQGEASLTLSQFRKILLIILNYMENLQNDFLEIIQLETTAGDIGDCIDSEHLGYCAISPPPQRMLNLHYKEGLSIITGFISELSKLM